MVDYILWCDESFLGNAHVELAGTRKCVWRLWESFLEVGQFIYPECKILTVG